MSSLSPPDDRFKYDSARITKFILRDLQTSTELHDVWASATAGTKSTLIVSARLLREELQNTYAWVVRTRYPDLVTQVFDTIMQLLTDNNNWNPDIITVYQFISAYREKKLAAFIEGLAHEAWIILSLCSRAKSQIVHVFQRLSQVPVVPPTDCLRHIALLLIDTQAEIRNMAESYLNRSSGGLREDMIAGYRVLLEHDHNATRSAACRALAVLKAEQCIRALDYISRSDTDAVVRQEAKRALGSFDVLAAERAIVGDQAYIAVNRCDTRM